MARKVCCLSNWAHREREITFVPISWQPAENTIRAQNIIAVRLKMVWHSEMMEIGIHRHCMKNYALCICTFRLAKATPKHNYQANKPSFFSAVSFEIVPASLSKIKSIQLIFARIGHHWRWELFFIRLTINIECCLGESILLQLQVCETVILFKTHQRILGSANLSSKRARQIKLPFFVDVSLAPKTKHLCKLPKYAFYASFNIPFAE